MNSANHLKNQNKKHQNARSIDEKLNTKSLKLLFILFKISNSIMLTAEHLVQTSCTEFTLIIAMLVLKQSMNMLDFVFTISEKISGLHQNLHQVWPGKLGQQPPSFGFLLAYYGLGILFRN